MSSPEHKQKIWKLIKNIKVGMLVTLDGESPRSRPMHLVQDDYDGTLWFFTRRSSEKSFETQQDNDVCISFADQKKGVYVSMTGRARLTDDSQLKDRFWSPFVAAWFPDGKEDPDLTLMEIKIDFGEHWLADDNKLFQLFEIARANVRDDKPDLGENEKFD